MVLVDNDSEFLEDDDNGVVKWVTGDKEYTFWTDANYVKPFIIDFLKERFPGKLVARELNLIDLSVPEENLPVEVQATSADSTDNRPKYSELEQNIEKQINQNIKSYGVCWFFFDSELLRAMKNACRNMSINMVWFRNYMKEEKLKVFTISHDGVIEEKTYKDFDFLSKMSQTCLISAKSDEMILNDNKLKIYANIMKAHDFGQDEIDKFYEDWRKYCKQNKVDGKNKNKMFKLFLNKQKGDRAKLYGYILRAMGNLTAINDILGLKNIKYEAKFLASVIGIFDVIGGGTGAITTLVNRSNICKYFPGYLDNSKTWDKLRGHSLNTRQFENIIKNGIGNYFWYEDYKNDVVKESGQIGDKGVIVTIENSDQIITVNIKDKPVQRNIEDAWEGK